MRLIAFIVAMIAASAPASAQGWREYEYPNEGFTAAFPAEPKVETTSYQASGGRLVEARVYSVVQEGGEFKVTVADLSHTEMSEGNVMAYAVLMLSRGGEIKIDIPHSTRRIVGRQASIDGVDGSQIYASVFFHNRRLYQIEGTAPAGGSTADAIRFQQSFDFTDGWRLPDALSDELRRPGQITASNFYLEIASDRAAGCKSDSVIPPCRLSPQVRGGEAAWIPGSVLPLLRHGAALFRTATERPRTVMTS
jgi:hypothetical protein